MSNNQKNEKTKETHPEGYSLVWDKRGLIVSITDYHAEPFFLSWKKIISMAESMGYEIPSKEKVADEEVKNEDSQADVLSVKPKENSGMNDRKTDLESASMALPGYWISPAGTITTVRCHITAVFENPEDFGFTQEELAGIYDRHEEKYKANGKARDEILEACISRGWIKVQRFKDVWTINTVNLDAKNERVITKFVQTMLSSGKDGVREYDPYMPVVISDEKGDTLLRSTMGDVA